MYTPSPFMEEVLSEKTINELDGNIPGVNFLGGNFLRGSGRIFQGGV